MSIIGRGVSLSMSSLVIYKVGMIPVDDSRVIGCNMASRERATDCKRQDGGGDNLAVAAYSFWAVGEWCRVS